MLKKTNNHNEELISLVVPVLNESRNIPVLYERVKKSLRPFKYELIFVNDGSDDSTIEIVKTLASKDTSIKLINLSRNFGHQLAVSCGLDFAEGDAVVIMDADLQDPPELIVKMIKKWKEGYDVVYAVRKERRGEAFLKRITAKIFYRLLNLFSGTTIPVDTGDFRLISRRVVLNLRKTREYRRFLRGIISWVGFSQIGIEFERDKRYAGKSHYSVIAMIKLAFDAILSFSIFPLRLASVLGVLTVIFSVFFAIFAYYKNAAGQTIRGWSSTVFLILFLGSIQLVAIGIIGEYLGRIYEEVKRRPLYIIDSTVGFENFKETDNRAKVKH